MHRKLLRGQVLALHYHIIPPYDESIGNTTLPHLHINFKF